MKNVTPESLRRQLAFKRSIKMSGIIKGASHLNVSEFGKYDTMKTNDPIACPSKKVARSRMRSSGTGTINRDGDGDVWVEKIYHTKKDKRSVTVFVSKKTGKMVQGEPPTGAARVIFLKM